MPAEQPEQPAALTTLLRAVQVNAPRAALVLLIELANDDPEMFARRWRLFDPRRHARRYQHADKTVRRALASLIQSGLVETQPHGHLRNVRITQPPTLETPGKAN